MSIIKSKSTPILNKEAQDELNSLKEIEIATGSTKIIDNVQQKQTNFHLKCIQIAVLYACLGSVFYNNRPHIMSIITYQFKNGFCLSPILIPRPSTQALITSFMSLVPCSVVLCYILKQCKFLNETNIYKPLKFLAKIQSILLIPYSLHYGDAFAVYILTKYKPNRIMLIITLLSFSIYIFSFSCFGKLEALNYGQKPVFYLITQQIPTLVKFLSEFFNILFSKNSTKALIIYNIIITILFIALFFYIHIKKPFDEFTWNKRSIAGLAGGLVFNFMNLLNFFLSDLSSYWMTFSFIGVIALIYFEHGKIPPLAYTKRIRRNSTRPAYSETLEDIPPSAVPGKRPLIHVMKQDVVTLSWFFGMILVMALFNAYASINMPLGQVLPDFVHKLFPNIGAEIRSDPAFSKMQFSNLLCTVGILSFFIMHCFSGDTTNGRKIFTVYGTLCVFRMLAFALTLFPAPCTGLPNCPCSDEKTILRLRNESPLKVAVSWVFGLGMYSQYPQCGDLIVSGHTMFMWMTFKWHYEVARRLVRRTSANTIYLLLITMFLLAISYITLARNHYTVDIWFGFILAELMFDLYTHYEEKMFTHDKGPMVKFIRWVETRKYPLVYSDYDGEEESISASYDA